MDSPTKNQKKTAAILNKLLCSWDYGFSTPTEKCTRRKDHKARVLSHRRHHGHFPSLWRNEMIFDHFDRNATLFGCSSEIAEYWWLAADVDMGPGADPQEAQDILKAVEREFAADSDEHLFCEPSTSGVGGHGYFLVRNPDEGRDQVRPLLDRWARGFTARWLAEHPDSKLKQVEIKGYPATTHWGAARGEIRDITCGALLKLPRTLPDRLDEWDDIAVLDLHTIRQLAARAREFTAKNPEPGLVEILGSIQGHPITPSDLATLPPLRLLAASLFQDKVTTKTQAKVRTEDGALTLLLLYFAHKNPLENHAQPIARYEATWTGLYRNRGLTGVHRAWDHNRFAALRNHLSAAGLLVWHRHMYVVGTEGEKGQACCFTLAPELVGLIEDSIREWEALSSRTTTMLGELSGAEAPSPPPDSVTPEEDVLPQDERVFTIASQVARSRLISSLEVCQ